VKRHQLTLAPMVVDHIRTQVFHIAQDSIDPALAWEDRLLTAIKNLADFSGYAVDEEASARLGYPLYRLVFERTYLVHFTIDKAAGVIRIVNFRHGSRLPKAGEP